MQTAAHLLKAFKRDDNGAVAPIFGVMFIVLILIVGIALDYGRIHHAASRMTAAVDAAVLAGGKALLDGRLDDAEVTAIVQRYLDENLSQGKSFASVNGAIIEIDRATNTVRVNLQSTVPTTIMKLAHVDQVSVPVMSVATFQQRDVELSLALDLTGSMRGRKLEDLKSATADLVDIMLPDAGTPNKVRIAFAPYDAGVNAGTYAAAATNGRAGSDRCTYERQGLTPESDDVPGTGTYLLAKRDLARSAVCPTASVIGLTNDKRLLKDSVRSYAVGGSTAGHLGVQWASYLVSPHWAGILGGESEPAAYDDHKTVKAIVLMTDGEFNTWEGSTSARNATSNSNERAIAICEAAKVRGVQVFTIGFQLDTPLAIETLSRCASDTSHYFLADNGTELRAAFAAIGNQLNNLRLSE